MELKQEGSRFQSGEPSHTCGGSEKKLYAGPELTEWGSLLDLTKGSLPGGIEDADFMSATAAD